MKIKLIVILLALSDLQAALILNLSANNASSLTLSGGNVTAWTNSAGGQSFTSETGDQPTYAAGATPNGSASLLFNGSTDVLRSIGFGQSTDLATIFIVTAPLSNAGIYRAFLSGVDASSPGHFDFASGLNIDQTLNSSGVFNSLNIESAKGGGGGGINLKSSSEPFGTFDVLAFTFGNTPGSECLYVNGSAQGCRADGNANPISLQDLRIGARYASNYAGEFGYLNGYISDVEIYNTLFTATGVAAESQNLANQYINPASAVPEPSFQVIVALLCSGGILVYRRHMKPHA